MGMEKLEINFSFVTLKSEGGLSNCEPTLQFIHRTKVNRVSGKASLILHGMHAGRNCTSCTFACLATIKGPSPLS